MSLLINTISSGSFFKVNKTLVEQLESFMAAALLTNLVDRFKRMEKVGDLDEEGGFCVQSEWIEEDLFISGDIRRKLSDILIDHAMIRIKKKGMPSRNFYYLNEENILQYLSGRKIQPPVVGSPESSMISLSSGRKIQPPLVGKSNQAWLENPITSPYIDKKDKIVREDKKENNEPTLEQTSEIINRPSSGAILATWKPQSGLLKVDVPEKVSQLFATLKDHGYPKDELSTDEIVRSVYGKNPPPKIKFMADAMTISCNEQRELYYSPEVDLSAPVERKTQIIKDACFERTGISSADMAEIEESRARVQRNKELDVFYANELKKKETL